MCGRFALYSDPFVLARWFGVDSLPDYRPSYNVAPSQAVAIIRQQAGRRSMARVRWGLVPAWSKAAKTGFSTINARAETVASKPAFRAAFRQRRCLVPADGWYEWQALANTQAKQPWFISSQAGKPLALAGLWELWQNPQGGVLESCSIIVTEANDFMQPIHERMPVILAPASWDDWLSPATKDTQALHNFLKPYAGNDLTAWPVSVLVNSPRHDSAECLAPINL
jgi:putative SOS response-associated peptidase YedK